MQELQAVPKRGQSRGESMKASKRWQPKDIRVVPRQTQAFKAFIDGCEVTVRKFESAIDAARRQGLIGESLNATGFGDGAGRFQGRGNSTVVYRGL